MSNSFPGSPKLLKGGLVLVDATSGAIQRVITLQYNPDTLSRTLQAKTVGTESPDRSEALRLKGPAVETIKLEAEIDAADQLEQGDARTTQVGIHPQLAALETIIYPTSGELLANERLAQSGTLEIIPMEAPLTLFVWSKNRVVPVRLTEFSITEEAFDPSLNPIRAKVSLSLRALSTDDLGFSTKAGSLFMTYLQTKQQLASRIPSATLATLGIAGIG
jgi:Contractile injection system tube protein